MTTLALTNTLIAGDPEDIGEVQANFTDVVTWANGNIGTDNLAANTLADADFASTAGMYTAYREVFSAGGPIITDRGAGTYWFRNEIVGLSPSGSTIHGDVSLPGKWLDDADFTIAGRNTRLRVRGVVLPNATQPAITFTFGLYPVTLAGGADALTLTLGAVVASSTAAVASPAASTPTAAVSADFAVPADGFYVLGVVTSGALTNNNSSQLRAELQQHWT